MKYNYLPIPLYPDSPLAPILEIEVCDPLQKKKERGICLLDTGADMTVIPNRIIVALELNPATTVRCTDYKGEEKERGVYIVRIFLGNFELFCGFCTETREDIGLIGRDILNQWVALFDGPKQEFSLKQ
ncbi:MAG: retroviral-like aspartic protease family protein [bacterium]